MVTELANRKTKGSTENGITPKVSVCKQQQQQQQQPCHAGWTTKLG